MKLYTVNEFNFAPFILGCLMRRPVYLLSVEPLVPVFGRFFYRLVTSLERAGLARRVAAAFPELRYYDHNPAEIEYAHLYPRFEAELSDYYQFGTVDVGDYGLAFKHAASSRIKVHLGKLVYLNDLETKFFETGVSLPGLPEDLYKCFHIAFGRPLLNRAAGKTDFRWTANLVSTLVVAAVAIVNVLLRIRISPQHAEQFVLGADLEQEPVRDFFKQVTDAPEQVLFILRNTGVKNSLDPGQLALFRHATLREGRFALADGLSALKIVLRDSVFLFRHLSWAPIGLFFDVVKLVNKRIVFRALLNRYHFNGFLSRDEYNNDHIIRSQELRRAGIPSLGLTHGMSTGPRVYPHTRYLDFDTLFVFGKRQYEAYSDTWPRDMTIKPIGLYKLTRAQLAQFVAPRNKDILLFANQHTDTPKHIQVLSRIVESFPDRRLFIKLKYRRQKIGPDRFDAYINKLGALPKNVSIIDQMSPYDAMRTPGYSFSGLSTVVAEALQLGLKSFFIDTYRSDQDIFFRDFPDLCVTSAEEAIARIHGIEDGTWNYPRELFEDLIDLSGQNPFDVIRSEVGLPPLEARLGSEAA